MQLSIVVITRNRRELLKRTLFYLLAQEKQAFFAIEIIIVDDGSTDRTRELVEEYKLNMENLLYVFRPHSEHGPPCVSHARNLGIQRSSGDIIVFLDCGVLIPPDFSKRVAEHYLVFSDQVLIHPIAGMYAEANAYNFQKITSISPQNISQEIEQLIQNPEWMDIREGLFDLVNDQLDRLPVPWTLVWSCILTIPKCLLENIGGFDESFLGWGAEDIDLGYRLYQSGASFIAKRDCVALHIPHERLPLLERIASDRKNRLKLHQKVYRFDTELYYYYTNTYYNRILNHYNNLMLVDILPRYAREILNTVYNNFLRERTPTLLIGADSQPMARHLPTTHNFVHNQVAFTKFSHWFPDREIQYLLGCSTPYTNNYFSVVILTDFVRILPKIIQYDFFKEIARISQKIVFLYTEAYFNPYHDMDGNPCASLDEMKHLLEPLQLHLIRLAEIAGTAILTFQTGEDE